MRAGENSGPRKERFAACPDRTPPGQGRQPPLKSLCPESTIRSSSHETHRSEMKREARTGIWKFLHYKSRSSRSPKEVVGSEFPDIRRSAICGAIHPGNTQSSMTSSSAQSRLLSWSEASRGVGDHHGHHAAGIDVRLRAGDSASRSISAEAFGKVGVVIRRQTVNDQAGVSVHEGTGGLELARLALDQRAAGVVELGLARGPAAGESRCSS